jgi:acetamidase/formamidase
MKSRGLCLALMLCVAAAAASARQTASASPQPGLAGEWILTIAIFGNETSERLQFKTEKGKLSGSVRRRRKEVVFPVKAEGDTVEFVIPGPDGGKQAFTGKISGGVLSGKMVETSSDEWGESPPPDWRARRATPESERPASPRTLDFEPVEFHRVFSASIAPAMKIWPGDIVRTRTVDAAGVDETGKSRVLGGNPQTGPFSIEGAMPGDVIAVRIRKLRLNRGTAISDDGLVDRALTTEYAGEHKDNNFNNVVWKLDAEKGVATLAKPPAHLKDLAVPVRPMLGCVGVAPGFGGAPIRTGDSGRIGGNMDFSEIREGATVYLPVAQPGALLYIGDGHALQGDGELNGNALETSLAVEFSVDVLREKSIGGIRVENDESLMAMGLSGSLDQAFREATSALASWLEKDYALTGPEAAILLGATIQYQISEVADRNVGVVAKIRKQFLPRPEAAKK